MTDGDAAEDVNETSDGVIPVSPARFTELQQNGLCGLAPERALMRVDLVDAPYEDLAEIAATDIALAQE